MTQAVANPVVPAPFSTTTSSLPAEARSVAAGVRLRVLVPLAAVICVLVLAFVMVLVVETRSRQDADISRTATAVDHLFKEHSLESIRVMRSVMEQVLRNGQLDAAFRARDRAALLDVSAPMLQQLKGRHAITHFYYLLPDGTALLRVHAPEHGGDKITRAVLREAQQTGKPAWGNEQGALGSFTLRVVYPWVSSGQLLGYLEMGVEFENIMRDIKAFLDVDVFVAMAKAPFDRVKWERAQARSQHPVAWDEFASLLVISRTTQAIPPPVKAYLDTVQGFRAGNSFEAAWDGKVAQTVVLPFADLRGRTVGELVVVRDVTAGAQQRRQAIIGVAILGALIGGGLMLSFYFLLGRVQRDVAQRTARLGEAENRGRMVEELAVANQAAKAALRANEQITRKLRETQGELVVSARQAGMAEIATSVLHNVGNVLNSVNVSADLVSGTLRTSRGQGLSRAVELMNEHAGELGHYLTHDERGKMLPSYLDGVAQAIAQERTGMMSELEHLTRSIDHIKAVVATQQSYAGAAGMIESVQICDLAEDALRMNVESLTRHRVTVVRQFAQVPPVRLDRARVLQILVNLISNAKNAMENAPEGTSRMTLSVEVAGDKILRLRVRDEGQGIHPGNLTRIFAHGFTTRKAGHGFGLHSSALAAREMGGSLAAHSDGPGRGATFTLDLPFDMAQGGES